MAYKQTGIQIEKKIILGFQKVPLSSTKESDKITWFGGNSDNHTFRTVVEYLKLIMETGLPVHQIHDSLISHRRFHLFADTTTRETHLPPMSLS
ncbi:MAG: hypothetical protein KAH20_04745 [Methylococcales bacterium]|nr:hypothetical protein [Methylococcales bacterium]